MVLVQTIKKKIKNNLFVDKSKNVVDHIKKKNGNCENRWKFSCFIKFFDHIEKWYKEIMAMLIDYTFYVVLNIDNRKNEMELQTHENLLFDNKT